MIALVGVLSPSGADVGTVEISDLPPPPAPCYRGFAVRCSDEAEVNLTLSWYQRMVEFRPQLPLGLIAHADDCVKAIVHLEHTLTFLLDPSDLVAGALPARTLETLQHESVVGRIMDEILAEHGPRVLEEQHALQALVSRAVDGHTIGRAARDLGIHRDTLSRRLRRTGLAAGWLKSWIRLRAFHVRVSQGMDRTTALAAGGWTDHDQRRKAAARLRGS